MEKFIKSIFSFLLPILICLFFFFLILIISTQILTSSSKQYKFEENIELLFLGDSHITNAVIDSLIPNAVNLAKRSEPYYYTYQRLKFISNNSKIEKVILGYSYHNISSYYDEFISGHLSAVMPHKLFFCLEFSEKLRVLNWNRKKLISVSKKIFKSFYHQYYNLVEENDEYSFYDGYNNPFKNEKVNLKSLQSRISFQFYSKDKVTDFAELNIIYLKKIIDFCQEKNIKLSFLITPLHPFYISKVPSIFKYKFHNFAFENKIDLINLESLNLSDSCYVPDGDHVTTKGAEITTSAIIESLN